MENADFATRAAKHYNPHPKSLAGIVPPVVFSSTFLVDGIEHSQRLASRVENPEVDADGFFYTRWGNPTNEVASKMISTLEGAAGTYTFCSGMNAITTTLMTLLRSGDHVVAPRAIYSGTFEWLTTWAPRMNVSVTFVDATNIDEYTRAKTPQTRIFYAESPANPTMRLTDLETLGRLSIESGVTCVVDSTFATPYHVSPLSFQGVKVVVHSATKYLGGHSDITAGSVSSTDELFLRELGRAAKIFGGALAPMDSYLLCRGLKTLDVRMERHAKNALQVALYLSSHPSVVAVHYPGLPSHPDHALAIKHFREGAGFGGMLSFDVGSVQNGRVVVERVQLANLAVSLGAVETLIEHPASMTHASVPQRDRLKAGITDGLLRLSVGIEAVGDIIEDLQQALSPLAG